MNALMRVMGERNGRVAVAASASVLQRAFAIVGTFIMFPRVLNALGADQFGVWGAAMSLSNLVAIADFGVGSAILTLVAHALASRDAETPRDYFAAALVVACVISLALIIAGSVTAILIVKRSELAVYLIAVAGVAVNVPLGSAQSGWLALQRGWVVAFWDFVQTVFLIAGLSLAVQFTTDVRFYVAAVFSALVLASSANLACLLVRHPELRPTDWITPFTHLKKVVSTGARYFALSGFDALSYVFDNVLALQLLGAAASAKMVIVQRICLASLGLLLVVAQPLWPAFVEASVRGDRRWIFRALVRGAALMTGAAIAGSCIIVVFGQPLLRFWLKQDIGIESPLLWVMAIWIVSLSVVRVQVLLLNALQITTFQIRVFAVATLISFPLKFILAPRFGIAGILLATAATFPIIILPAIVWRIGKLRRDFPEMPDARALPSSAGAARLFGGSATHE
jgi:O-antigen/teichoic acid export membrane protein